MKPIRTSIIKHRTTGIYQLRYRFAGDTRWTQQSLCTRSKAEANRKRNEFIASSGCNQSESIALLEARICRIKAEQSSSDISIESAWKRFRSEAVASCMAASTLSGYESYAKSLMAFAGKDVLLSSFCKKKCHEYLTKLHDLGISKSTASRHIKFFSRLWREVAASIDNPWKEAKATGNGKKLPKLPFKLDHIRSIVNGTDGEWKLLYMIMAYTGLRLVDACLLSYDDIDFDRRVIELYPRKTKDRGDNPMQMKCGLHPVIDLALRATHIRHGYFMQEIAEKYIRDKSSVSKQIQRDVIEFTGLVTVVKPEGRSRGVAVYGAHSFRKHLSDAMREAGVDPMVRLRVLGHKDAATEMQAYSHVKDSEVFESIQLAMPSSLGYGGVIQMRRAV